MTKIKTEIEIQNEIVEWLNENHIPNWRISSVIMSNFPDLLVLYRGRFVALEIKKSEKAKVRQGQLNKIDFLREHGAVADIVWSLDHVKKIIAVMSKNAVFMLNNIYNYKGD